MKAGRFLLLLSPALLLAACGDSQDHGGKRDAPSAPIGFELAMAGAAAAGAGEDTAATTVAPLVELTPQQLAEQIKAGKVRLIDVRTPEEVAQGAIAGAENIPLDQFDPAKLGPSDGRKVVLYCRSGKRSAIAGEKFADATGEPVDVLAGGILAWEAAGQPVEKR